MVLVHASAKEGGGATRTEGASTEEFGGDAGLRLEVLGCVAEAGGDLLRSDRVPAVVAWMVVVVKEDRSIGVGSPLLQAQGEATEGLCGAEEGVGVGTVAHLFTANSILLVREAQGRK